MLLPDAKGFWRGCLPAVFDSSLTRLLLAQPVFSKVCAPHRLPPPLPRAPCLSVGGGGGGGGGFRWGAAIKRGRARGRIIFY